MKLSPRTLKPSLILSALLSATAAPAWAADGPGVSDMFSTSLKTLGALILVLALILIIAWLARRYLHFLPQGSEKGEDIRILSVKALGPKRYVHLLEVDDQKILIGSSEGGMTLLKEFGRKSPRE